MGAERDKKTPPVDCCHAGSDHGTGAAGTSANCGCCAPPAHRSWTKVLIAAIVMLAAVGVGMYSLMAGSTAGRDERSAPCRPAVTSGDSLSPSILWVQILLDSTTARTDGNGASAAESTALPAAEPDRSGSR